MTDSSSSSSSSHEAKNQVLKWSDLAGYPRLAILFASTWCACTKVCDAGTEPPSSFMQAVMECSRSYPAVQWTILDVDDQKYAGMFAELKPWLRDLHGALPLCVFLRQGEKVGYVLGNKPEKVKAFVAKLAAQQ